MKKIIMMLTLVMGLMSCGGGVESSAKASVPVADDRVEVLYFHGKQRCATCMAIEKNVEAVVNTVFADELKNGSLVFKVVDISTPEGEELADRYEVSWSSLYVNKWKDGTETRNDMTKFGFTNARNNPDLFKEGVSEKIRQLLR